MALTTVCLFTACAESDREPYARWRNGIIVHVRNCDAPANEAHLLKCAGLYCAQRASQLLTNAQQAQIRITNVARANDGSTIHVTATLTQYMFTPRLPNGFHCAMDNYREAAPEFRFARASPVTPVAAEAGISLPRRKKWPLA